MSRIRLFPMAVAIGTAALVSACESSTDVSNLVPDAALDADITASAGDAIVVALGAMGGNEGGGGSAIVASNLGENTLTITRTMTCLDASNAVVAGCTPFSSVRKIAAHVTMDGTRTGSNDAGTKTWAGAVHRTMDDTVTRVFTGPTETARAHAGVNTGNDTTQFTEGDLTRSATEAAIDSVNAVTWNLPRSSNPWPVSGSFVRRVNVKVTATKGDRTESREVNRRIQVTFPADAQGNVDLVINDKTCNLNLVTGVVTNCS